MNVENRFLFKTASLRAAALLASPGMAQSAPSGYGAVICDSPAPGTLGEILPCIDRISGKRRHVIKINGGARWECTVCLALQEVPC